MKGLDKWAVKEDFEENIQEKHLIYQGYTCLDIPEETIFTIFEPSGNKRGTQNFNFYICKTSADALDVVASPGRGRCQGDFKIVCAGEGKTKAPRLMDWWIGFVGDNGTILDAPNTIPASNPTEQDSYAQLEQEIKECFKTAGLEEPKLTQAYQSVVNVASGTMGRDDIDERLEMFFS